MCDLNLRNGGLITLSLDKKAEKKLRQGYENMAQINVEIAEQAVCAENEALEVCEDMLTESE